jgi:hypothetical protein
MELGSGGQLNAGGDSVVGGEVVVGAVVVGVEVCVEFVKDGMDVPVVEYGGQEGRRRFVAVGGIEAAVGHQGVDVGKEEQIPTMPHR